MAMLAEPRRKQKWTLNPRGKQWSDDSNKFGQKMLEKMGWSSGKGLGANEQGMTEHVRVKFKDDQSGIGFSKSNQDKLWTEQQESFDMLLQNLQTAKDSPAIEGVTEKEKSLTGKSLELKSKQSRARVHYQKFTRGKDVNKYSTKDLANIFGKKDLNESAKVEVKPHKSNDNDGSSDVIGGVVTITGGTINDYFKNKMPVTLCKSGKRSKNDVAVESESESERYVGFGFSQSKTKLPKKSLEMNNYSFVNAALDLNNVEDSHRKRKSELHLGSSSLNKENAIDADETPKKRKTLNNFAFENSALDLACPERIGNIKKNKMELSRSMVETPVIECISQHGEDYEKNVEVVGACKSSQMNSIVGRENDALDLTDEVNGKKRVTFNDKIEYNTDSLNTKKKSHKKKQKKNSNKLDKFEVELDKSVKKKLKNASLTPEKNSFVNEALDVEVINEESVDNEANERKSKKTKRKKIRPVLNLDTIHEEEDSVEVDNKSIILTDSNNCSVSEKKRYTGDIDESNQDSTLESSKKKKRKTKKEKGQKSINEEEEMENKNENENELNSMDVQDVSEVKPKKEKKKKRKEERNEDAESVSNAVEIDEKTCDNSNCVDELRVNDNEFEKCKTSKPKKIFKALFNQSPIAHFIGSNINEMKGYGVEL